MRFEEEFGIEILTKTLKRSRACATRQHIDQHKK